MHEHECAGQAAASTAPPDRREPEGEGRQAPLEHREKLVKVKKLAHMIALMGVVGPAIAQ
ncbi:hypothetical protein [Pseudoduganella umbonata]|uniref:Uncharacterized protein n=1 Tax=Pseudoduganella umbonata TaxID=864828 RepID=A0A7W5EBS5_9BURK|nr:hypothetical protein [Pseudoduganella umbonata]MBB3222231.1 hypothetical protein [Pseudoduganella umbonata]